MRILITGSKGLIGSALKRALESLHINVTGFDHRFETEHPDCGNILEVNQLHSAVEHADGIIHLAAVSRVIDGEKNPELCWQTNVEGTKNVVECALASLRKPWIIYASSREVYGQQETLPVKETVRLAPVNIYGKSKQEAEQVIQQASDKKLLTAIVRFSNVFGSVHDHHDRVVPAFCRAAVDGTDIRVDGKDHIFDFTYIEDVVQGILALIHLLMLKKESLPPVHLTRGIPVTLKQIAEIAKNASHHPVKIVEGVSRSFDVSKFYGDTNFAKTLLHWQANVSVEEGMHRLINQYRLFEAVKKSSVALEPKISHELLSIK